MTYHITEPEFNKFKQTSIDKWVEAINLKRKDVIPWWHNTGTQACGFCELTKHIANTEYPKCRLCPFSSISVVTEYSNGVARIKCSEYYCKMKQLIEYNCAKYTPKKYRHFIALAKELLSQIQSITYSDYNLYLAALKG